MKTARGKIVSLTAIACIAAVTHCFALAPCAEAKPKLLHGAWQDVSDGYKVTWSGSDLRAIPESAPDKVVFSARDTFISEFTRDHARTDDCSETRDFQLLSLAGDYLSYQIHESAYCSGAAHPDGETRYVAINLHKGGVPAQLTDIFLAEDVYSALMNDKVVQKALEQSNVKPIDLPQLMRVLDGGITVEDSDHQSPQICCSLDSDLLSRFAFHHIVDADHVAIRIGLSGTGVCRERLTELGLILPMPQVLQTELNNANAGTNGILMKDSARLSKSIKTSMTFDTKNMPHKKVASHASND